MLDIIQGLTKETSKKEIKIATAKISAKNCIC